MIYKFFYRLIVRQRARLRFVGNVEMSYIKRRSDPPWWISIAALFVLLVFTHGADLLLSHLRQRNISSFNLGPALFGSRAILTLLLALGLLLLAWLVLIRIPSNAWVASLYLLIGLLIVSFPLLWFVGLLYNWLPFPLGRFLADFLLADPMLTYSAGGFVAAIGLFAIIRSSREKTDVP
jgi:hypothetical protein